MRHQWRKNNPKMLLFLANFLSFSRHAPVTVQSAASLQPSVRCLHCLLWTRSITLSPPAGDNTQIIICNRKWNSKNRPADMQPRTSHCLQLHSGVEEKKSRRLVWHKTTVNFYLLQWVSTGFLHRRCKSVVTIICSTFYCTHKNLQEQRYLNPYEYTD